jgi:hypothetical protein
VTFILEVSDRTQTPRLTLESIVLKTTTAVDISTSTLQNTPPGEVEIKIVVLPTNSLHISASIFAAHNLRCQPHAYEATSLLQNKKTLLGPYLA